MFSNSQYDTSFSFLFILKVTDSDHAVLFYYIEKFFLKKLYFVFINYALCGRESVIYNPDAPNNLSVIKLLFKKKKLIFENKKEMIDWNVKIK